MDLSTLSDDDLKKLADNDFGKLSTDAKEMFKAPEPAQAQAQPQQGQPITNPTAPIAPEQGVGDWMMNNVAVPAIGVAKTGAALAAENPALASVAGAAAFPKVASKIPGVGQVMDLAKGAVDVAKNYNLNQMEHQAVQYMKAGQTPPPEFQARLDALRQAAMPKTPPPGTTGPSILQRGMDVASRMRQFAAQRVLPVAGVPAGVAAGGAAATGLAGGQMAAMTPEQRKAYYDSMMLGAMGGDAGLAAAIMNRGQ